MTKLDHDKYIWYFKDTFGIGVCNEFTKVWTFLNNNGDRINQELSPQTVKICKNNVDRYELLGKFKSIDNPIEVLYF